MDISGGFGALDTQKKKKKSRVLVVIVSSILFRAINWIKRSTDLCFHLGTLLLLISVT